MIFQEYALIERLTVMENVLSGHVRSMWISQQSFTRRFPESDIKQPMPINRVGLWDAPNKRADALSGGQRQR